MSQDNYSPHDVILFALRDAFPEHWSDADDFANVLLDKFEQYNWHLLKGLD